MHNSSASRIATHNSSAPTIREILDWLCSTRNRCCEALEKIAGGRGAKSLTVYASDNASEFFLKRGYIAKQRNTVTVNGEWLANTTMQKALGEGAASGVPT